MKVNLEEFRSIIMLVDQEKNVVIFPVSATKYIREQEDGSMQCDYYPAFYPIELQFPYTVENLAERIKYGIEQWNQHPCYEEKLNNNRTFEEKYYGIKGFKNAVKGKLYISLGWDDIQGKYVSFSMPLKRGYAYIGIDDTSLSENADWVDFANAVMKYINADITKFRSFKTFKSKLNI